jgi:peptide/nickel transport system permease protein
MNSAASSRSWPGFLARRLARFAISLFLLVSAAFGMVHAMPGDPVRAALGMTAPQALVDAKRRELGLDQSLWHQYLHFLHGAVDGNLGTSMATGVPVRQIIGERLAATALLAGLAFLVAFGLALPLGMAAGIRTRDGRRPRTQLAFGAVTGVATAVPDFLLAVGLVFVFAVSFQALPVAGRGGADTYVLPVAALVLGPAAALARVVRVETVRVLSEDYMRTARAKRLPDRILYLRHALPNLLTATLTVSGLTLGGLLAGTVLVENVFAWPGLGPSWRSRCR